MEPDTLEPGSVEWLTDRLEAQGGESPMAALEEALTASLPSNDGSEAAISLMRTRVLHAPQMVALPGDRVALTRHFLQGAYFRYTPTTWELERGVLRLETSELALVCALDDTGLDQEVRWRGLDESEPHTVRLARSDGFWVLPGLGGWFDATGFTFGDDVVVHVREVRPPLFVLDRVSRFDRDEGPISRRNARLVELAIAILAESGEGWLAVDRLVKMLVGRYDYRGSTPPDSFGQRLLDQDTRFTQGKDGREVRLSHFHHEDTARAYLARVNSAAEALPVFFEEYPPQGPDDRDKALAYLEQLWRHTPRAELNGLTPAQMTDPASKIVPFGRREPQT
jgi:hypothetical protein